jgi:hypothetical protein
MKGRFSSNHTAFAFRNSSRFFALNLQCNFFTLEYKSATIANPAAAKNGRTLAAMYIETSLILTVKDT